MSTYEGYEGYNTNIDKEYSLYSREIIKSGDNCIEFFQKSIGQYDKNGEVITQVDSNVESHKNNLLFVTKIRFRLSEIDESVRRHLMEYAYFIFIVGCKDFITCPIYLMDNYFYFLEKNIKPSITIHPFENFSVTLYITKPYDKDFKLTCELVGWSRICLISEIIGGK
jgi:hypothetical protein